MEEENNKQPEEKQESYNATEVFQFVDTRSGKEIRLTSGVYDVVGLCEMAAKFLGLKVPEMESKKMIGVD